MHCLLFLASLSHERCALVFLVFLERFYLPTRILCKGKEILYISIYIVEGIIIRRQRRLDRRPCIAQRLRKVAVLDRVDSSVVVLPISICDSVEEPPVFFTTCNPSSRSKCLATSSIRYKDPSLAFPSFRKSSCPAPAPVTAILYMAGYKIVIRKCIRQPRLFAWLASDGTKSFLMNEISVITAKNTVFMRLVSFFWSYGKAMQLSTNYWIVGEGEPHPSLGIYLSYS